MTIPQDSLTPLILVSELRQRANFDNSKADANGRLLNLIVLQSAIVQGACRRRFDEFYEQRFYTPFQFAQGGDLYDLRTLRLDMDIKSTPANTVVINGDASQIATGNMQFLPGNSSYKQQIRLNPYGVQFWYHAGVTDPRDSISVTGTWGWGGSWIAPGATLNTAMSDTVGTSLVSAGNALENGMVLLVDAEQMIVSAAGTGSSPYTNTVVRGFNGTTPTTHPTTGINLYRWQANAVVRQIVTRLVQMSIEQDKSPLFGQIAVGDNVQPIQVDDWPKDMIRTVQTNNLKRMPRLQSV